MSWFRRRKQTTLAPLKNAANDLMVLPALTLTPNDQIGKQAMEIWRFVVIRHPKHRLGAFWDRAEKKQKLVCIDCASDQIGELTDKPFIPFDIVGEEPEGI